MGWIDRLTAPAERPAAPAAEQKTYYPWSSSFNGQIGTNPITATGLWITENNALQTVAVYSCVRVLSESIASLPVELLEELPGGGCQCAEDHPVEDVLCDAPNSMMTPFTFFETLIGHAALRGNGFAWIERKRGIPVALWPLRSDRMQWIPGEDDQGRPAPTWVYTSSFGKSFTFYPSDLIHIKGLGGDGVMGYSPISLHRQAIGLAKATEESGARFFGNSARPAGVFTHPQQLSQDAFNRLKSDLEAANSGVANTGRIMLLEEGMSWSQIGLSNEDAQYLATREFQTQEIARLWRIPAHMIGATTGDKQTYANIEQRSLEFIQYTLLPWLKKIEQELTVKLLTASDRETYKIRFNVEGLLRADIATRFNAYQVGINAGFLLPDEVREREGLPPLPEQEPANEPPDAEDAADAPEMQDQSGQMPMDQPMQQPPAGEVNGD